ncbi:MarR family winged helix-turn-helix transcriptional regulator [Lentilactobacillus kisonensis]|uniref:Transcriptional regulator, MarR family n=1 Tax=Lentilactobacillus kisonensis F0435 TaxID=797516 RepID=H1LH68_9LACO|nr:winged helix DNA-binding protein [Lentilactobacillus kisonensis]EHO50548.1 transcriptional regulator, MarR family [Lentilactobacillus kisonensis F0435]
MKSTSLTNQIKAQLEIFRSRDIDQVILNQVKGTGLIDTKLASRLTINDLHVIQVVAHSEDAMLSDIVAGLPLTQGAVSKIVNKLATAGLLTKTHKSANKKETYIQLTRLATQINAIHEGYHQEMNDKLQGLTDQFTSADLQVVREFLEKLNKLRQS